MMRLLKSIRAALSLVLLFTVLLGGVYTVTITGLCQSLFNSKANGSLVERGETVIGSFLIGQQFESPKYFWGRISALTNPYNPENSGGSNLSVNNPKWMEQGQTRIAALQKADPKNSARIPVNLITASASGLDPDISVAAAQYQIARVARTRSLKEDVVKALVEKHTHTPFFGYLGDAYVNVVSLNLALDDMAHEGKKEKR